MAPDKSKAMATLDSDELSFLRHRFKQGDVKDDGRIGVAEVLSCVEEMDFIVDGSLSDLARSIVPEAVAADALSLNDAVRLAAAAKAQDQAGMNVPEVPSISREDSLAELEISFNRQVRSGEITADVIEEEPESPTQGLSREDSLAQLKSSYHKQALTGNLPAVIMEGESSERGFPSNGPPMGVDVPKRRRSIAVPYPAPPSTQAPRSPVRGRAAMARGGSESAIGGPEVVVVDDLPKRRSSVARPGGGSLVGLQAEGALNNGDGGNDDSMPPASREMLRQDSEMELLGTASSLGTELVEATSVPKKRQSFAVSPSWLQAAAEESARSLEVKKLADAQAAEAARQKAESERIRAEVDAHVSRLIDQVEHNLAIAQAREEADESARAAALEVEKAEAAAARIEIETALRLLVESLERDAAVAAAKEEADRLVQKETEAREAAEMRAIDAAKKADEALRLAAQAEEEAKALEESSREANRMREEEEALREEERAREEAARLKAEEDDKVKEEARQELQAEAELLRSKLQEAGEEAAERAQEEAQAKAQKEAEELRQAEEQAQKEARLVEEAKRSSEREMEAKESAEREAKEWEKRFNSLQREREEEIQRVREAARQELERAVEEAREFEKNKVLSLRAAEEERSILDGANVSYDDVNDRDGKPWWQCVVCVPDEFGDEEGDRARRRGVDDDNSDDDATVDAMKLANWTKAPGFSASTRSMDRPGKGDVCTIS